MKAFLVLCALLLDFGCARTHVEIPRDAGTQDAAREDTGLPEAGALDAAHEAAVVMDAHVECVEGSFRCTSPLQSQLCERGYWDDDDECDPANERCDGDVPASVTFGTCIDNPLQEFGSNTDAGSSYDVERDAIYAQPIRLPWDATLDMFGMRTTDTSSGGRAYLSIYTDDGSADGAPAQLINRSPEISLVQADENARTPFIQTAEAKQLRANTTYWIVAYAYETASSDPRIYHDPTPGPEGHFRVGTLAYGTPAVDLSDVETIEQHGQVSIWIRARRVP